VPVVARFSEAHAGELLSHVGRKLGPTPALGG
jgi:hypothetical protein